MQQYSFTPLPGLGWANGINDKGLVVGTCANETSEPQLAAWWIPSGNGGAYDISTPDPENVFQLTAINNVGVVIPGNELICIKLGNANSSSLPPAVVAAARALNNNGQLVSGDSIYFWPYANATPTEMPLLDGKVLGLGINDLGDVVGSYSNPGRAFFYPRQPIGSNPLFNIFGAGFGNLVDINNDRLAVGYSTDQNGNNPSPAFVQCPSTSGGSSELQMTPLQPAYPLVQDGSSNPSGTGTQNRKNSANAVNDAGTIVGTAIKAGGSRYAFFVPPFSDTAYDLNDWVGDRQGWNLETAADINEQGQIVGLAQRGTDTAGYVATPYTPIKWEIIANLLGNLIAHAASLTSAGTPGGMGIVIPPGGWSALTGSSLTPEQRETLLSFALSNLAGGLSDSQARSRIQAIAAEAASRALAQGKTRERPAPTPAQLEQLAKMRSRMLP
jgi:hypothetical protein